MKSDLLKKLSSLLLCYFAASCLISYAQVPNISAVSDAATGSSQYIKIILNWLMSIAGGIGAVVVGFKLFGGKPDAKEGIMYWVGGIIFCVVALLVINSIGTGTGK